MATDPKKSLTPTSIPSVAKTDVDRLLQTGLADFSLRELLGMLISSAGAAERDVYLQDTPSDKPNGFYDRSLQVGSIPVDIRVPRSRNGDFRPASLPLPYRRGYGEEVQSLLVGLLGSSRSINAAKDALQKMGLSRSEQDLVLLCYKRFGPQKGQHGSCRIKARAMLMRRVAIECGL